METQQILDTLAELRSRARFIDRDIVALRDAVADPVAAKVIDRAREGASLLHGLLWSAHMAVEMERERSPGQQGSLP